MRYEQMIYLQALATKLDLKIKTVAEFSKFAKANL